MDLSVREKKKSYLSYINKIIIRNNDNLVIKLDRYALQLFQNPVYYKYAPQTCQNT
jgi:hypothetical protein